MSCSNRLGFNLSQATHPVALRQGAQVLLQLAPTRLQFEILGDLLAYGLEPERFAGLYIVNIGDVVAPARFNGKRR